MGKLTTHPLYIESKCGQCVHVQATHPLYIESKCGQCVHVQATHT